MEHKAKSEGLKNLKSTWEEKPLHGQYPLQANNGDVELRTTKTAGYNNLISEEQPINLMFRESGWSQNRKYNTNWKWLGVR